MFGIWYCFVFWSFQWKLYAPKCWQKPEFLRNLWSHFPDRRDKCSLGCLFIPKYVLASRLSPYTRNCYTYQGPCQPNTLALSHTPPPQTSSPGSVFLSHCPLSSLLLFSRRGPAVCRTCSVYYAYLVYSFPLCSSRCLWLFYSSYLQEKPSP